jgi:hypothetical protein
MKGIELKMWRRSGLKNHLDQDSYHLYTVMAYNDPGTQITDGGYGCVSITIARRNTYGT